MSTNYWICSRFTWKRKTCISSFVDGYWINCGCRDRFLPDRTCLTIILRRPDTSL